MCNLVSTSFSISNLRVSEIPKPPPSPPLSPPQTPTPLPPPAVPPDVMMVALGLQVELFM